MFFANGSVFADAVKRAVTESSDVRTVVVDLEAVTDVDVTGAEAFSGLKVWLRDRDITLAFSRPRTAIAERFRALGLIDEEPLYPTNRAALAAIDATPRLTGAQRKQVP